MARGPRPVEGVLRRRGYAAGRVVRSPLNPPPEKVLGVWRRVLERRLRTRLASPVVAEIHDNTHTMVTFERVGGVWRLRLHHMFLAANEETLDALSGYVRGDDPQSSAQLDHYIERNRVLIRRVSPERLRRRLRIDPRGDFHDLEEIFQRLNRRYFRGQVEATITYGPAPTTKRPRKSIKMGSYSAESRVIRIHPALDQPQVPVYFVEWIVFHEMLHQVHKARRGSDGRRLVHTPEFLEHEKKFHDYERALAWESENLHVLLNA